MLETKLGKIKAISFGYGGYQDAMIGVSFSLGGDGWSVGDFWGQWATKRSESTKWTEVERETQLGKMCMKVLELLKEAKVDSLEKLKEVPVEVSFQNNAIASWRILKEVL